MTKHYTLSSEDVEALGLINTDQFDMMKEAIEAYLHPQGNMKSLSEHLVNHSKAKAGYDRACNPFKVKELIQLIIDLRTLLAKSEVKQEPNVVATDWVNCPVCGDADMRKTTDQYGNDLICCVNHACLSNGGNNQDAVKTPVPQIPDDVLKDAERYRWLKEWFTSVDSDEEADHAENEYAKATLLFEYPDTEDDKENSLDVAIDTAISGAKEK